MSLLIAGHETSSNTACWILHLLATNPEQQAAARREADAAPATPSYQDFLAMTTLVGAVYEALRLYTIIIGPSKKTTRDDQIPGVPAHTYVVPNKTVMARKVVAYGNAVEILPHAVDAKFDSRVTAPHWLISTQGKMGEPHCPFGAGPRICVGLRPSPSSSSWRSCTRCFAATNCSRGPGLPGAEEHVLVTNGPRESGLFPALVPRARAV